VIFLQFFHFSTSPSREEDLYTYKTKYEVVNRMSQELTISEFNELANQAKKVYSINDKKVFFEAKTLEKANILLVQITIFLCKDNDIEHKRKTKSVTELFDIVEMRLHKKIDKILKHKTIENMCEITNYYIFSLK